MKAATQSFSEKMVSQSLGNTLKKDPRRRYFSSRAVA